MPQLNMQNIANNISTKEILLLQRYSKLVDELQAENEVLREELVKATSDKNLHYDSKVRWQLKYETLEAKVKKLL